MHFACLVKQACVDLASDLFVYYRLGMSLYVFGAYKNFESENKNQSEFVEFPTGCSAHTAPSLVTVASHTGRFCTPGAIKLSQPTLSIIFILYVEATFSRLVFVLPMLSVDNEHYEH